MKRAIVLMAAVLLCVSLLAGCGGGGGGGDSFTGKYGIVTMELMGEDVLVSELEMTADDMFFEFQSGGKVKFSALGDVQEGTFAKDGDTISVTLEGQETLTLTLDGTKLTADEGDGNRMTFEKQ